MNKELEEAIEMLKKLKQQKYVSLSNYEAKISINQATAIETVSNYIDNSISKEVIEKKKNQMLEEYKEVIETNSTKAFIMKCQIEFAEELLKGGENK